MINYIKDFFQCNSNCRTSFSHVYYRFVLVKSYIKYFPTGNREYSQPGLMALNRDSHLSYDFAYNCVLVLKWVSSVKITFKKN